MDLFVHILNYILKISISRWIAAFIGSHSQASPTRQHAYTLGGHRSAATLMWTCTRVQLSGLAHNLNGNQLNVNMLSGFEPLEVSQMLFRWCGGGAAGWGRRRCECGGGVSSMAAFRRFTNVTERRQRRCVAPTVSAGNPQEYMRTTVVCRYDKLRGRGQLVMPSNGFLSHLSNLQY